tara:strand:- start:4757 stop:5359 length:603 start_codon:yes stop_codon:yes gene_type:complete
MIKAIIFDLGGVVFHPDWKSMNEMMGEEIGISIFLDKDLRQIYDYETMVGKTSMEDVFKIIIEKNNIDISVEDAIRIYKKSYEKFSLFDENIIKLIADLRKKFKIYALSNTNLIHKQVNEEKGLFENFDDIFMSYDLKMRKPDENIFKEVLKKVELKSEECVFIDDNPENIEVARGLGFKGIKFENYEKLISSLKKTDLN